MQKKKVLIHSNHCKALTGFGKNAKNILIHLHKTGKYEIVEFSNGKKWADPSLKQLPWKCIGSLPNDPKLIETLSKDPSMARSAHYGSEMIDKVIESEKPDVYIGIEDIWAFSGYTDKIWWNKVNSMIWTTLDSLPILPEAVRSAPNIKNYYTWASFAQKSLNKMGYNHVKTLRGAIDTKHFFRLSDNERSELRKKQGLRDDEFIIGFVFRNQLRKSVPNLLQGFNKFLRQNPNSKAKLLFHTNWTEGWDIKRLMSEHSIDPNTVLTTHICKNCKSYEIKPFKSEDVDCSFCGSKSSQITPNTSVGASEQQLNEIYNLMDVYCHPFTSGGQEIPIQEAKLTELITLVTNYSCGEDSCVEGSGSLPLKWTEYREQGTQFIKASTDPNSISNQLNKVFNMQQSKRKEIGKKSRDFVLKNYSIKVVGEKLEEIIDNMPYCEWDFDFTSEERNPEYNPPEDLTDSQFIIDIYKNILKKRVDQYDEGYNHWIKRLKTDLKRDDVLRYFKKVASKENSENKKVNLEDLLSDDKGKRILINVPTSEEDVFLVTSLFKNLNELYPDHNIYVATKTKFFEILDGNPYVHKCIPFHESMNDLPLMEGYGEHDGYFEMVFQPCILNTLNNFLTRNNKDKIQFDLCTK